MRTFQIAVPAPVLEDLRRRLVQTRRSPAVVAGWSGGTDGEYIASFVSSWANELDWRATESNLNVLPQVMVPVDGVDIHAFHIRARPAASEPIPLVLTHGWPSSFFELLPLAGPLTDPLAHDGEPTDLFDLVIPSLPGFTNHLGAAHAERIIGVFTHHPNLHPDMADDWPISDAERHYLDERRRAWRDRDGSYSETQANRPDSLAPALSDSPAGLAAWILDKYRDWSDCHGDLESVFDRRTLLDIATLYWVTNSIGTSFLPYVDDQKTPSLGAVTAPAGLTLTPEDAGYPREFAERTYSDIRMWRGPAPGGHFLALERPDRLVRDLRDFFRPLRTERAALK